ncbi:hypothetical protein [Paludisphaera rhizosphaerae]|uniref:hypothetical protein n=1 Tax=Paludisphaera rhizosphaerae TaxID=2711216 RepID=UPI0013EA0AF3|nr:hypothetical protein [Paludisphaera rhizosphaerae]
MHRLVAALRAVAPGLAFATAALTLALIAGCSEGTSGNPADFAGPLDTSKAQKSDDAPALEPGVGYDGSGKPISKKKH